MARVDTIYIYSCLLNDEHLPTGTELLLLNIRNISTIKLITLRCLLNALNAYQSLDASIQQ